MRRYRQALRDQSSRFLRLFFLLLSVAISIGPHRPATTWAEVNPASQNRSEELRGLLTVGLMPASQEQEAFLNKVVLLVAEGTLSLRMVEGTFIWARKQAEWPYPYFEQALRLRAHRAGIKI